MPQEEIKVPRCISDRVVYCDNSKFKLVEMYLRYFPGERRGASLKSIYILKRRDKKKCSIDINMFADIKLTFVRYSRGRKMIYSKYYSLNSLKNMIMNKVSEMFITSFRFVENESEEYFKDRKEKYIQKRKTYNIGIDPNNRRMDDSDFSVELTGALSEALNSLRRPTVSHRASQEMHTLRGLVETRARGILDQISQSQRQNSPVDSNVPGALHTSTSMYVDLGTDEPSLDYIATVTRDSQDNETTSISLEDEI